MSVVVVGRDCPRRSRCCGTVPVKLIEAAQRASGGRALGVKHRGESLDNGQHLLLGRITRP
jgi:hypothetical protein